MTYYTVNVYYNRTVTRSSPLFRSSSSLAVDGFLVGVQSSRLGQLAVGPGRLLQRSSELITTLPWESETRRSDDIIPNPSKIHSMS